MLGKSLRAIVLTSALALLLASAGIIRLRATKVTLDTRAIELLYHASGMADSAPLYNLTVMAPTHCRLNDDIEVLVTLDDHFVPHLVPVPPPKEKTPEALLETLERHLYGEYRVEDGFFLEAGLQSESFKVAPSDAVQLPLKEGHTERFIATPQQEGRRKLLLRTRLQVPQVKDELRARALRNPLDPQTRVIDIEVGPPRTIVGLSEKALSTIATISAIVGVPGLIALLVKRYLDKASQAKEQDARKRVILP